jgi:transposase, IS5 family
MSLEEQWQPARQRKEGMLEEIDKIVDWQPIERMLRKMYSKNTGRPAIAPLGMFKLLLVEYFYDLSDVKVVEELHDRRSFERFCDIDLTEHQVDDSSLVRFRKRLEQSNLMEHLFEVFNKQLESKGLIVKKGTLIDSTLVQGAHRPGAKGKSGNVLDEDVTWTSRNGQGKHGMKVSIGVDEGSEIVRKINLTTACEHDAPLLPGIVCGDEKKVYADKGYASESNREYLMLNDIDDGILHKATRNHKLKGWQVALNKLLSSHRCAVERKFAEVKRWHGMERMRYRGLERSKIQVYVTMMLINMKRMVRLLKSLLLFSSEAAVRP